MADTVYALFSKIQEDLDLVHRCIGIFTPIKDKDGKDHEDTDDAVHIVHGANRRHRAPNRTAERSAMAADIENYLWTIGEIVDMVDAYAHGVYTIGCSGMVRFPPWH